jgi:hypothetical protein
MNYKETQVQLSVKIAGCQALLGRYESIIKTDDQGNKVAQIERNSDGKMEKSDVLRLRTLQLPKFHDCELHTTLNSAFCAHAVSDEARPKKTVSVPYWNKLSNKNRLILGVTQYVQDLYGRNAEFTYQILGE